MEHGIPGEHDPSNPTSSTTSPSSNPSSTLRSTQPGNSRSSVPEVTQSTHQQPKAVSSSVQRGNSSAGTQTTAMPGSQRGAGPVRGCGGSGRTTGKTPSSSSSSSGSSSSWLPVVPTPIRSIWSIQICPTTGGQFQLCATPDETIDGLKKTIAKKLKLTKERITLLNKERVLKEGSLRDNGLFEGCKLTLLPNIESGLMSQRPEHTVMQALENLSDIQVNDFLSGKSPLTLAMRLGDHMMFVQLQLSTSPPSSRRSSTKSSTTSSIGSTSVNQAGPASPPASPTTASPKVSPLLTSIGGATLSPPSSPASCLPTPPSSPGSPSGSPALPFCGSSPVKGEAPHIGFSPFMLPSPHNLSSTPSAPLRHHHHHSHHHHRNRLLPLHRGAFSNSSTSGASSPTSSNSSGSPGSNSSSLSSSPCCSPSSTTDSASSSPALSPTLSPAPSPPCTPPPVGTTPTATFPPVTTAKPTTTTVSLDNVPLLDSSALAEASRNLSQKLKELSQSSSVTKEVKQTTTQNSSRANGAIIESMQHHGQGIYSGTFSGTLNPALQDRDGKPKRSISTIVHILNDLLGATPQYRAQLQARPAHHPAAAAPAHLQTAEKPHPYHQYHLHQQQHHHHHGHHRHHHHHHHHHHSSETPRSRAQCDHGRMSQESRLSQENRATRGKMEQLQQMLEERRQRRRARREARSTPYSRSWAAARGNRTSGDNPAAPGDNSTMEKRPSPEQPMEVDVETANMDKVQEKGAYGELTQETVVA